ncbi:MAG: hypothetical protein EXR39_17100 [Betaproteobacteria bacterium]|nr:hypothetical protein [Betaproteobacteria bacterium]
MFPLVAEAIGKIVSIERLRYVAFSHYEADECGSLNDFLAAAAAAVPVCSRVAAMVSVNDVATRPARALADGEVLKFAIGNFAIDPRLGGRSLWHRTPCENGTRGIPISHPIIDCKY